MTMHAYGHATRRPRGVAKLKRLCLASSVVVGCAHTLPATPPKAASAPATATVVDFGEILVTAGELLSLRSGEIGIRTDTLRAEVGRTPRSQLELKFRYLGPSERATPLASGELRSQIGLKLRAADTCNVVYVMWQIAPAPHLEVSVKHNPDAHTHEACGDRGYVFLTPSWQSERARNTAIQRGETHTLAGQLRGEELEVTLDGEPAWRGVLPKTAFEFDGPVGIRSDNGKFDVQLRIAPQLDSGKP